MRAQWKMKISPYRENFGPFDSWGGKWQPVNWSSVKDGSYFLIWCIQREVNNSKFEDREQTFKELKFGQLLQTLMGLTFKHFLLLFFIFDRCLFYIQLVYLGCTFALFNEVLLFIEKISHLMSTFQIKWVTETFCCFHLISQIFLFISPISKFSIACQNQFSSAADLLVWQRINMIVLLIPQKFTKPQIIPFFCCQFLSKLIATLPYHQ